MMREFHLCRSLSMNSIRNTERWMALAVKLQFHRASALVKYAFRVLYSKVSAFSKASSNPHLSPVNRGTWEQIPSRREGKIKHKSRKSHISYQSSLSQDPLTPGGRCGTAPPADGKAVPARHGGPPARRALLTVLAT